MKRKLLWTSLLACLLFALLCCAAESGDFTIDENGVLTKYTGSDAVVTVPDGVTAIGKEAFYAKSAITEIHLPTGITLIGDSAFRSCTGLTELHLPTGITSIGDSAFRSCAGLTEIVVPDSVKTIGDGAFYGCSGLTSLRLSQGLKTLGANVFLSCDSLTEIEIPAGVESVGNYIASNTLRLRCAVGSSAAKALSKAQNDFWVEDFQLRYAFDSDGSAASLTLKKYAGDAASVTIPDGVTIVGDSAFNGNTSLTAVVLPDSVVTIGANAFRSCTGLTAVTLSQNLNEIKTYAFGGCTGLTYIDIPAGLQKSQYIMGTSDERVQLRCAIGSDAAKALSEGGDSFCADDYQLRYSFDSDGQVTGLTVRKYLGSAAVVTLPEGTTEIGSEVFENHTEITEVVLPETLVTIGSSAFDGCTGLMRIVLPEALKTISFHAFMNCAALTEIVLPDGLTSLGSHAFYGCKKLTEMRVPDGILTLEVATFEYCANLTKVVLPSKLEKIANYAFHNCKALKEIQIPETVTEIGIGAFQYCAGLTELTLPDGLQTIAESAFEGCSGLARLVIPDGVQSVGSNAFHSTNAQLCCSMGSRAAEALSRVGYDFYTETWKLRYTFDSDKQVNGLRAERYLGSEAAVTLPEGTTLIGGSAFKDCAFITSVTLPEKLLSIGNYAFSGCTGLTEIVTPDSVTTIGSYAFSGCTGLTEIVIPDSVTTIGSYAFSGCTGLTRVVLPAGLTAIPDWCFNNCEKLPGIAIPETVTSIGSCAFRYCSALTAITLPQGLQTLGANAFLYCENLPYVDVPDTLESAGSYIASDTTQLRCSIGSSAAYTLSKKNNSFYNNGYGLCYTYADRDGSVTGLALLKYAGTEAEVRVPDGVTELLYLSFCSNSAVTSVILPETVVKIGEKAFSECKNLTSVTIPQGIVEIQSYAFLMSPKLKVIDIPDGLQKAARLAEDNVQFRCSFGSSAAFALSKGGNNFCTGDFQMRYLFDDEGNRNGLRLNKYLGTDAEVTVPEEVTETGSAFKDCKTVTKVVLPAGLTKLESNIFSGCTGLTEIVIPDSVTTIGSYAFSGCTGLTRVVLPAGLTAIPESCFNNCKRLPGIAIPETVTSIGSCAFRYCSELTAITLPQGLQTLGENAFLYCENLPYVDVPDTLESAGYSIASDTTQLRCSIGSSAAYTLSKNGTSFYDDGYKLRYTYADRDGSVTGLVLFKYVGTEAEARVPDGVTELGSLCFWENSVVTSIVLPETVIKIGWEAFSECKNLTSVTIPQGVVEIQSAAFSMCPKLTVIDIPDGLQKAAWLAEDDVQFRCSFGSSAAFALSKGGNNFCTGDFQMRYLFDDEGNRNGLRLNKYLGTDAEVTVPEEVTETGSAFKDCKTVTKVVLPAGLTKLESDIFSGCTALKEIAIPEGVTSIGNGAFRDCEALTELALPQGLKKIESYVFIGCTGLSYIDIPDGLETAGNWIADDSVQLRCSLGSSAAIALSKSDNGFCVDGLRLCYRFDDDGNTNGLTAKRYLGSETEVTVPDGVDSIGDSAFYGCNGLTKLALPQGLKEIGGNAFLGCEGLSYIDIPDGVEKVNGRIASESTQLRCSLGSSAAIALSKSDNGFCVDGLRLCYRFDDDGNTNGLTAKRYLGSETEVTVPDGVDSIGDSAFYGCKGLTKLALPQGLKEIGVNAFLGCEGLSYIDIPDGVETVGDWIASESIQLRCSLGSSAAIALSKAEQNFCVDDFAVRHSFTDGGAVNGLIAERYVGGKVGAVLTLPQGVTETSQYLLNEEPLENVMCLKLPEGFKKLNIDNLLWRSAVVFPESIQSIAIEEEWEGAPPVIFYCYRDTVAESFAQKRGITIVYLDGFKPAQTTVAMRSDYTLPIGSELRLSEIAAAVPSMPENCALNAVSSNPEVLQVESDGTIRVVGKGDATLRVSLSRYPDIYAEACVWGYVQPTSATLAEEIWIPAKAARDLLKKDLIILPADNRAPIGYGMDNWELFEQLEGEFTLMAVNRGDTALYVEVPGFDTLTAQIHVTARFSELAFEQTAITIPADTRATLCAQAVTTTHTYVNEYMTFESSAPDVAAVDEDGVVYGVSEGSATITATSYNGLTAACTVNVQGGNGSRLKLPAFLKEISEEAFAGCSEESVIVPDGCETIGARAFADSANLRTIMIPASVTSIAADAFDGCTDLTIRTPKGSYASRYAAAHGFGCVAE